MPAKTQHPRITDKPVEKVKPTEDDGTVPEEELAKDPNAADYLKDQENGNDSQNKEDSTGDEPIGDSGSDESKKEPGDDSGADKQASDANNDLPKEEVKAEEPKKPELPAIDLKGLSKDGGAALVGLVGLITQMQQQMMELQAQVSKKVDSERVDPKVFLVSGADSSDQARHQSKAEKTAEKVNAQPKKSIFIPLEGKEKLGKAVLTVTINGHRWNIPKGIYVEVPEQVGQTAMDSLNQTAQALESPYRLDNAPEDRQKALQGSSGVVVEN